MKLYSNTVAVCGSMCTKYLNNSLLCAPFEIDPRPTNIHRKEQIYNVIQEIFPAFLEFPTNVAISPSDSRFEDARPDPPLLPIQNLNVKPLDGGLSNHLFLVTKDMPQSAPNSAIESNHRSESHAPNNEAYQISGTGYNTILVRVYPDSEHKRDTDASPNDESNLALVDRNVENNIFAWLASANEAPVYFGQFRNGRLEEFYEGYRPLAAVEMGHPKFARAIGMAMARLHRLNVPNGIMTCDVEKSKRSGGEIWDQIDKWLELLQLRRDDRNMCDAVDVINFISEQRDWLKLELHPTSPQKKDDDASMEKLAEQFCSEVVFTHMDCQSLNILTPMADDDSSPDIVQSSCSLDSSNDEGHTKSTKIMATIHLIDFEYAAMNPRAVDLANTFCEHCDMNNFAADYEKQYPSKEQQNLFLRAYIHELNHDIERILDERGGEEGETEIEFLDAVRGVIGKHVLLSHLLWCTWAVAQMSLSSIEFDYLKYAKLRMEGYGVFKQRYWPDVK